MYTARIVGFSSLLPGFPDNIRVCGVIEMREQ
jgi:hypothetical protein